MSNYQKQGLSFIRFVAAMSSNQADFSVVAFGNPIRTAAQARPQILQQ